MIYVGCAGWSLPKGMRDSFGPGADLLQRYATRLDVTEINRTFYSMPRKTTMGKWADETPKLFRFTLKLSRLYTHIKRLRSTEGLEEVCESLEAFGEKLLAVLVQLPPSLSFEEEIARPFFSKLVSLCSAQIVCEPRDKSWMKAQSMFEELRIARVAADPARFEFDSEPGGYTKFAYYRLHGSPKIYYSSYDDRFLRALARKIKADGAETKVVIFDNTASGAAFINALRLKELVDETQ